MAFFDVFLIFLFTGMLKLANFFSIALVFFLLIGFDTHMYSLQQLVFWPYNGEIQKVMWPVGGFIFTKTM